MSGPPEIVVCAGRDSLYERAARRVAEAARASTAARGRFAVALSGGSTPRPLFERLADPTRGQAVAWEIAHVFWADERCVPQDHEDSNYRLANEALLEAVAIPPERVHRIHGEELDPEEAAARYERELRETLSVPPRATPHLDLVLLGLGPDGHTASLFPDSEALDRADRLVVEVAASEPRMQPPVVERITLTPRAINAAYEVLFLVTGEAKAPAVAAVLEGPREPARWPAQAIDPLEGRVSWLLDAAAAAKLAGLGEAVESDPP
ncbi:MAG: 6-phosphogluconolactonase [Gemmatimonadetes bacterium]|nr:6-phosphogluconolactonase [Gemmatimonadota bacterium]